MERGHQEKEFDHIFSHLMQNDYDIIDYKLQALHSESSSGLWIVCLLGAKTKEAFENNIDIDYQNIAKHVSSHIKLDPLIEHDC